MFDSTLAFDRYRLEVVERWPDGREKEALLVAIKASLVNKHTRNGYRENWAPFEPQLLNSVRTRTRPYEHD
jgi:hypothetical protein